MCVILLSGAVFTLAIVGDLTNRSAHALADDNRSGKCCRNRGVDLGDGALHYWEPRTIPCSVASGGM